MIDCNLLQEHNKIIGMCDITKLRSSCADRIRDQVDSDAYQNPWLIGYWVNKNYEGKGYASEAATILMKYGEMLNIDCFLAHVDPANEKSAKLVKRLGFDFLTKAMMKNASRNDWPNTVPCDMYVYKIIG